MTGKPIKARAANGRLPNGDNDRQQLQEIERVAWSLVRLPPEERAAAALAAFPPSNIRVALYHYAKGSPPAEAARLAGCHPRSFELYLQQSNSVGGDLRQVMKGIIETEMAPAAFAFLYRTMLDEAAPMRCRVDCGKIIIDRAGYLAAPQAPQLYEKELQSMSLAELEGYIKTLEAKKVAQLKDVTPAATDDESADDAPADDTPPPH
ncbi:hypothetical protein QEV83_05820 [Methylocapsa sp. D3K7]|uniref:hypothetical protein n=1 Tax=Methylocapsa sp. D3K7 TaxID=3041435 RepID=UPI00244E5F0C|nr:hypothetical protein [Methylocapsa sp. D3K7]WGJ15776.1 hypothetical protein QEV83_05820 [Methylocapsa sp. D3K7]